MQILVKSKSKTNKKETVPKRQELIDIAYMWESQKELINKFKDACLSLVCLKYWSLTRWDGHSKYFVEDLVLICELQMVLKKYKWF